MCLTNQYSIKKSITICVKTAKSGETRNKILTINILLVENDVGSIYIKHIRFDFKIHNTQELNHVYIIIRNFC